MDGGPRGWAETDVSVEREKVRQVKEPSPGADSTGPYVLGHSDRELKRLSAQARIVDPITRTILNQAGVVPGMRVLDVGSGAGDVAFLAAELVGAMGEIVGVDRAAAAVGAARQRAAKRSLRNVSFRVGDPVDMSFERHFDAVIGRYVLQFQHDPVAMLRNLAVHLRPGGVIVFHELDWEGARSFPPSPTYDRCCRWIADTIRLSGAETRMGVMLPSVFANARLPVPSMRLEAVVGSGGNSADPLRLVADVACTLLPEMERFGVATAGDLGAETLFERMLLESITNASAIVGRSEIGAWSRV